MAPGAPPDGRWGLPGPLYIVALLGLLEFKILEPVIFTNLQKVLEPPVFLQ